MPVPTNAQQPVVDQRRGTAYHEAGHAVMAYEHRVHTDGIRMENEENKDSWTGKLLMNNALWAPPVNIQIAIAGPLAKAKFLAILTLNHNVQFRIDDDMSLLASAIVDWNAHDDLEGEISFTCENHQRTIPVKFGSDLCGLNKTGVPLYKGALVTAFRKVREFLDNDISWKLIQTLADHLAKRPATRLQRVSISGQELASMLECERQKLLRK